MARGAWDVRQAVKNYFLRIEAAVVVSWLSEITDYLVISLSFFYLFPAKIMPESCQYKNFNKRSFHYRYYKRLTYKQVSV